MEPEPQEPLDPQQLAQLAAETAQLAAEAAAVVADLARRAAALAAEASQVLGEPPPGLDVRAAQLQAHAREWAARQPQGAQDVVNRQTRAAAVATPRRRRPRHA